MQVLLKICRRCRRYDVLCIAFVVVLSMNEFSSNILLKARTQFNLQLVFAFFIVSMVSCSNVLYFYSDRK